MEGQKKHDVRLLCAEQLLTFVSLCLIVFRYFSFVLFLQIQRGIKKKNTKLIIIKRNTLINSSWTKETPQSEWFFGNR